MRAACIGEPVSWLKLEQRDLGELPAMERADIDRHLVACEACRGCAEQIGQAATRPLRPLPQVEPRAPGWLRPRRWRRLAIPALSAAAALLLVVFVGRQPSSPTTYASLPPARIRIKGGELAISLVRERAGQTESDPTRFAAGDRFKVLVTCPPPAEPHVEVAVIEPAGTSFPLPPGQTLACGNQVPIPGAFTVTGSSPTSICAVVSPRALDRAALAAGLLATDDRQAVCVRLSPAAVPHP